MVNLDNWPGSAELMLTALAWVMTYALHSTALLGGTWLVFRVATNASDRLRDGVWKLALVGGMVTATAQVGMGLEPFGGRLFLLTTPDDAVLEEEVPVVAPIEAEQQAAEEPRWLPDADADSPQVLLPRKSEKAKRRVKTRSKVDSFPIHLVERKERPEPEPEREEIRPRVENQQRLFPAPRLADELDEQHVIPRPAIQTPVQSIERFDEPDSRWVAEAEKPTTVEESADEPEVVIPHPSFTAMPPIIGSTQSAVSASPWLVVPWIAGIVLGALAVAFAILRLRRVLHRRRPLTSGPVAEIFSDLKARSGVKRRIRLSTSTELATPITFGVFFSEISLPVRALTDLDPEQQEAMLAHELAHAVRRDPMWQLITKAFVAAFFFQPLNRLARTRMLDLAEYLSDDWAVAHTGRELPLASCLTEVAHWIVGTRKTLVAPGMAGGSRLSNRVYRLLDRERERTGRSKGMLAQSGLAIAGLVAFAGFVPGVAAAPLALDSDLTENAGDREERSSGFDSASIGDAEPNPSALARIEGELVPVRESIEARLLRLIQRALKTLDLEIEELLVETESLREVINQLADAEGLDESVALIENRISQLRGQRDALANEIPRLIQLLEGESAETTNRNSNLWSIPR